MAKVRQRVKRISSGNVKVGHGVGVDRREINEKYKILRDGGKINFPVEPEEREKIQRAQYLEEQFDKDSRGGREYVLREGDENKADTPQRALELYHAAKINKTELPIIAFSLGLINDPDECSINTALKNIKKAAAGEIILEEGIEDLIKQNTNMRSSKGRIKKAKEKALVMTAEERLEYQRKIKAQENKDENLEKRKLRLKKKSQYTNEAYTGNGSEKPGTHTEESSSLETQADPERYIKRKHKVLLKKDLQPKSDVDGEVEQFNEEDPRHEGLKFALKNINEELGKLSIDDLQEIKDEVSFLLKNNKKDAIVISEDELTQIPSPEDIIEEFPDLINDLRSNFNYVKSRS